MTTKARSFAWLGAARAAAVIAVALAGVIYSDPGFT